MKAVLGIFGIILILLVMIVFLFTRGPSPATPEGERRVDLAEYADSAATATYTIQGALVAEEDYREIRISVNRNSRDIEIIRGYNNSIIASQTFSNTQAAYDEFLHGLKNAGFSSSKEARYETEKGVCPLGKRFIYELEEFGDRLVRLWSSSCNRSDGSLAGNSTLIGRLFENQIPGHREITRDIKL